MNRLRPAAALLLACAAVPSAHATVDDARSSGLKWLVQTQKGDGSFAGPQGLEVQATAAAVEAMLAGGMARSPQLARALAWLANAQPDSTDARAWQAMALAAAGHDATSIGQAIRDDRNTATAWSGSVRAQPSWPIALWGPLPGYAASMADTALGFGALRSTGVSYSNDLVDLTVTTLCFTLGSQLTTSPWNGSWPDSLPQNGQPTHVARGSLAATALTLFELKKQRQANRFLSGTECSKTSPTAIDAAMASAKTWLIAQANGDGGLAERNPQSGALEASNPVATALAVRALALFAAEGDGAATTAVANARNWLTAAGQQNADGSWRSDPFVTARALAALPAAAGPQLADADNDGLPDVVEQLLGTQIAAADAQEPLATTAAAQAGTTAAFFAATGILDQSFSHALTGTGVPPVSYALAGGTLPPGLTLAGTGQITGTPTALGSYAFDYQATDATGARSLVIGRIDIVASAPAENGNADAPIPAWALLALGGALLSTLRRRMA